MAELGFSIDPDIRRARTLPSAVYCEAVWHQRILERVFRRTWHAYPGQAPCESGDLRPWDLAGEPLLLSRDAGTTRCLSNVCTHRGNILVDEPCNGRAIRCRYHGRRFALDGRMTHMPEFEGAEGFPSESDHLPAVTAATWGPLVFASLAPVCAFDELIAPVRERLEWLDVSSLRFDASTSREYQVAANWALYCDNYLEGFHVPFVHPGLAKELEYNEYTTELFALGVLQLGVGDDAFDIPTSHPDHGRRVSAYYFWLFPSTMINVYPWGMSINVVVPLGVEETRVVFLSYVGDPARRDHGAGADLHSVELEDEAVVAAVQRGVRSSLYDRGRYSPRRERGVHHFHRLLAQYLTT